MIAYIYISIILGVLSHCLLRLALSCSLRALALSRQAVVARPDRVLWQSDEAKNVTGVAKVANTVLAGTATPLNVPGQNDHHRGQ